MQDRFKFRSYGRPNSIIEGMQNIYTFEESKDGYFNVKVDKGWLSFVKEEDLKIMQCTGLKDKNGKLIYEGDILRNTLTNKYASVAWHNTGAGYVWSKTIPNSYLYEFGALFRVFGKYEVIGNIYENPELLEQL